MRGEARRAAHGAGVDMRGRAELGAGADMLDAESRAELAARWAYRAGLEASAAARFARLADRMAASARDPALVAIARTAAMQERTHVRLCTEIAARFGVDATPIESPASEVAPTAWSLPDRVLYEVVAFCCVTETANAAVVTAGADDVDDPAIRRAIRTILADEVQHSRLGWRFLATHPPDATQRAWLASHLPAMLAGTLRDDLFRDDTEPGDPLAMQRHGTLPIAGRRAAFLTGMREVLLPGLAAAGIDPAPGARFLDQLSCP